MNNQMMAELFGGLDRYKALRTLFQNSARDFGVRELATEAGVDPGNASRWLRRWVECGLLSSVTTRGTRYVASRDPALDLLREFLQQDSTMATSLRARVAELGEAVKAAAVFGSAARGATHADSDIDLLLITDMNRLESQAFFKPVGRELGRPVNVLTYSEQEWRNAIDRQNTLALDIAGSHLLELKGRIYGAQEAR